MLSVGPSMYLLTSEDLPAGHAKGGRSKRQQTGKGEGGGETWNRRWASSQRPSENAPTCRGPMTAISLWI